MKKLLLVTAMMVLAAPLYAQDGDSIDVTNILNGLGGNQQGGRGRGNQPVIPDSKIMYDEIKAALSKGKTPLDTKTQEKPLRSLLDSEIVALTDKIQLLRNGNQGEFNNQNNQGGGGRGGRGGNQQGNNNQQNNQQNQPTATALTVETVTSLKNQDFIDNKLTLFLTAEQIGLIKKAAADDKNNSSCLGGLLDRYYQQMQNPNRGNQNNNNNNQNNNRGNQNNNNYNQNQNQTRPNGMKYCMTIEATSSDRLEPIRKVLSKGNMPLAKDKETIADIAMKAELSELSDALRAALTGNNNNQNQGRGGNQNNNNRNGNQNPQQLIKSTTDNIYKKVEAMLTPPQAETLKNWHYTEVFTRGGIEALIAVEVLADTPLTDEQVTKVTAAWPEFQRQIQDAAKAANKSITDKQRQEAAMKKILETYLEPSQIASYKLAQKYGPETGSK